MDLTNLFESETSDTAARWEATDVHSAISNWLDVNDGFLLDELISNDGWGGCFALPVRRVRRAYPDLLVIFTAKRPEVVGVSGDTKYGSAGGFGTLTDGRPVIMIPCLLAPGDPKHLPTRFATGARRAFIHEFMHYLMWKRRAGQPSSSEKMRQHGVGAYFNDADETNAYYQEAAHSAEEMVQTIARSGHKLAAEMAGWSTQEFIAWLKRMSFDESFLTHASPKTMRALDKRLARFVEQKLRPMFGNPT